MDADRDGVIFEDHLYKQSGAKHGKLALIRNVHWKSKYFVLRKCGDKPVLEYYNKKPKSKNAKPKVKIALWPSYRVEKLGGANGRDHVVEITTAAHQLCVAADTQRSIDVFGFLVQCQARLLEDVQDNQIIVYPENSEAMKRIGAQNTKCILHTSPYGMTLALQATRSIIAQWPIKSIRCYESSGQGQLTVEAGRVAPMGEGVYVFECRPQEDNVTYDLLDKYIMETLDRAQPTRRGTAQEIEDYHQEFNQLHSLTVVKPCVPTTTVIAHVLKDNWNYDIPGVILHSQQQIRRKSRELLQMVQSSESENSGAPPLPLPRGSDGSISSKQSPNSRTIATQPISIQNKPSHLASQAEGEEPRLTSRPPPPPPRPLRIPSNFNSLPRSGSRHRDSLNSSSESPSARLAGRTPSSGLASPALHNWSPPPSFSDVAHFSGQQPHHNGSSSSSGIVRDHCPPLASAQLDADSYLTPVKSQPTDQYLIAVHSPGYGSHGVSYDRHDHMIRQSHETADASWLASASCEDLSDHMKAVLYDNGSQRKTAVDENMNSEKPPKPFIGLQEFHSSAEWDPRDRSRSMDYHNVIAVTDSNVKGYPSPSMRRIRKMMAAKGDCESLRKSVSNPNFINVGSLEKLNYEKLHGVFRPSSHGYSSTDDLVSPPLERETRHKSRSLIDLLSSGLRRHLSRDKLDQSRNGHGQSTGSPTHSGSSTPDKNRRRSRTNSLDKNGHKVLHRQESSKSITVKDPTFKDIRFTDRSRSFRKVKSKDGTSASQEKKECASEKVKRRVFLKQKQSGENQLNNFHLQNGMTPLGRQLVGHADGGHGFVADSVSSEHGCGVVHSRQHSAPVYTYREHIFLPIGSSQSPHTSVIGSSQSPHTSVIGSSQSPHTSVIGSSQSPHTSVIGSSQSPHTSLIGSSQSPHTSVIGSSQSPHNSVIGSSQSPHTSVIGSSQSPCTNVNGSSQSPRTNVIGSSQSPRTNVNGSSQSPRTNFNGSLQSPRTNVIGSLQSPRTNFNRAYDPVGIVLIRTESQSSV